METLAGWAYPKTLEIHPSQTLKYHTVFKLAESHGFLAVLRIPHLFQFMLHGSLDEAFTTEPLRMNPTWRLALSWLASIPADIPLGRHNLFGQSMFALVQEYETLPPAACRFESHREHVDLQFTLTGVESIDWIPRSTLKPDGEFNLDHDVGFWLPPSEPVTTLIQFPRRFAVFYPEDAHRPKGRVPGTQKVRKLVIKVPVKMLGMS